MTLIHVSPPLIFLVILNIFSMLIYGIDKIKSMNRKWRIPETNLLLLAFLAPFGSYTGMLLFRHKTRKPKFLLVPIFLIIQLYLIINYHLI
jgi:uncharacterized membrane protein YsdA (DUF1294 family)